MIFAIEYKSLYSITHKSDKKLLNTCIFVELKIVLINLVLFKNVFKFIILNYYFLFNMYITFFFANFQFENFAP